MWVWVLRLVLGPIIVLGDLAQRLRTRRTPAYVQCCNPYSQGPIAIFAMYQSGTVRRDVARAIEALRRQGVFTIVVNTGALTGSETSLADCYVERPNYGRDFASYKMGLEIAKELSPDLPDVIFCNDSVFYLEKGQSQFWERLMSAPYDMCAATDSEQVRPHLMSYCLRVSSRCANSPAFRKFWTNYVPTNLRPLTILLGEISLTRSVELAGFSRGAIASYRDIVEKNGEWALDTLSNHRSNRPLPKINVTHATPMDVVAHGAPVVKLDLETRANSYNNQMADIFEAMPSAEGEDLKGLLLSRRLRSKSSSVLDQLAMKCGLV